MHTSTGYVASHALLAAALGAEGAEDTVPISEKNLPAHQAQELATTGVTKIGRNDPCPCGSGKKFKRCHYTPSRDGQAALLGMKLAEQAAKRQVD